MKFKFKIQQYQTDAVNAISDVFAGQPYRSQNKYTLDRGIVKQQAQISLFEPGSAAQPEEDDIGLPTRASSSRRSSCLPISKIFRRFPTSTSRRLSRKSSVRSIWT